MPRRPPEQPSDLPPGVSEAIAAMNLDELRETASQVLDLAGARARKQLTQEPQRRRRRRAKEPFGVTVRVELVGAKPQVWRRLVLPSTLRLDQLHGVLQAVFDWTDSHLHRFTLDDDDWGDGEQYLCPYDVEEGEDDGVPASDVRLDEVLAEPGDALLYAYDFGDGWEVRLLVEQVGGPVEQVRLIGAEGIAPPEDCGGIHAWNERAGEAGDVDLAQLTTALAGWEQDRRLPRALRILRNQVRGTRAEQVLDALLRDADLAAGVTSVEETEAAEMTRAYAWLLRRVGDGVALTAAGRLPPAVVTAAMEELGLEWFGKHTREDRTAPVRALRASAQSLGLLRVSKGRLLRTKVGAAVTDDPLALGAHRGAHRGSAARPVPERGDEPAPAGGGSRSAEPVAAGRGAERRWLEHGRRCRGAGVGRSARGRGRGGGPRHGVGLRRQVAAQQGRGTYADAGCAGTGAHGSAGRSRLISESPALARCIASSVQLECRHGGADDPQHP